ncbi:MAG: hypothetical protein UY56_C0014G0001, partial [Parcubacteria group bacterium GW2011_GWA1_50_14]
ARFSIPLEVDGDPVHEALDLPGSIELFEYIKFLVA